MRIISSIICRPRKFYFLAAGLIFTLLADRPATASPPAMAATSGASLPSTNGAASNGFFTGIARRDTLLGDMWGLRPWLSKYGMTLSILETSEVLGNVSGGVKQGAAYDGLTQAALQLETERAFGWYGGTFNVSALQIHGNNLSMENLDTLQTASGIESDRATRLWELWYDQKFLEEDRLDIKVGQQSLDQEFMVSDNALLFVNTMFGWPMVPSADMPGGGPAYPLSALGLRVQARPIDSLTFLAGIFNGSPASNNNGDPQKINSSGASFPVNGGVLAIAEVQYSYPSVGSMVSGNDSSALSGKYKLGFWYDSENFDDEEYDNTGVLLANTAGSTGIPRSHQGNYAIYAVADQMIWNDPNDEDSDRSINVFARAMGTPLDDRNLVDFSLNAGFTFHEPFKGRDDDTAGIGMGYTRVSDRVADFDRDSNFYSGTPGPIQGGETFVEATYQYQLTPWCQLQPDFQYVFNPGGGVADPNSATGQRIKDEAVFGIRMNLTF
ncbi:MAG TPA: carbohydrate porin [Verrucomicrobiae bacterium]|jgi:porin